VTFINVNNILSNCAYCGYCVFEPHFTSPRICVHPIRLIKIKPNKDELCLLSYRDFAIAAMLIACARHSRPAYQFARIRRLGCFYVKVPTAFVQFSFVSLLTIRVWVIVPAVSAFRQIPFFCHRLATRVHS